MGYQILKASNIPLVMCTHASACIKTRVFLLGY
jgi:hypothetical protein